MARKKTETTNGWSRWDVHRRFDPVSRSLDCNMQNVSFCAPRLRRLCEKECKCKMPLSISRVTRDQLLEDNGVTPTSRAFLPTGYRTKKENAAINRDWRELDKIRKRWFKDCRPIRVEVTER